MLTLDEIHRRMRELAEQIVTVEMSADNVREEASDARSDLRLLLGDIRDAIEELKASGAPKSPARTAREMLDALDTFLAADYVADSERCALWLVLSALRGPDEGSRFDKDATTVPIRRAALPQVAKAYRDYRYDIPAAFGSEDSKLNVPRDRYGKEYDIHQRSLDVPHFVAHILHAKEALANFIGRPAAE